MISTVSLVVFWNEREYLEYKITSFTLYSFIYLICVFSTVHGTSWVNLLVQTFIVITPPPMTWKQPSHSDSTWGLITRPRCSVTSGPPSLKVLLPSVTDTTTVVAESLRHSPCLTDLPSLSPPVIVHYYNRKEKKTNRDRCTGLLCNRFGNSI